MNDTLLDYNLALTYAMAWMKRHYPNMPEAERKAAARKRVTKSLRALAHANRTGANSHKGQHLRRSLATTKPEGNA